MVHTLLQFYLPTLSITSIHFRRNNRAKSVELEPDAIIADLSTIFVSPAISTNIAAQNEDADDNESVISAKDENASNFGRNSNTRRSEKSCKSDTEKVSKVTKPTSLNLPLENKVNYAILHFKNVSKHINFLLF